MVAVGSPMVDAQYDEQTAAYIGVLERQLIGQEILIQKYRAVLEMATGEKHEDLRTDMEAGNLSEIAIKALQNQKGMTKGQAQKYLRKQNELAAEEAADGND